LKFLNLLTLLFIAFKITGVVTWSWWIVMSPILISIAIFIMIVFVATIVEVVTELKNSK